MSNLLKKLGDRNKPDTFIHDKSMQTNTLRLKESIVLSQSKFLGENKLDNLVISIDNDEGKSMGRKYNQYELQGVPVRIGV